VLLLLGCSSEEEPRPQLLVVVDTDLPVIGQLADDALLSPDAAVDTLRIDLLGADGLPSSSESFARPEARDWPVSFGVRAGHEGQVEVVLRLRAFRASLGDRDMEGDRLTLVPARGATIDRVVVLKLPDRGVRTLHVLLGGDCFGARPDFASMTTCVGVDAPVVPAAEGVEELNAVPPSRVGTWQGAREQECVGAPVPGRRCIPGGFSILGDATVVGQGRIAPVPLTPVLVSPFWMDVTEVTVGRFRQLVGEGLVDPTLADVANPSSPLDQWCSWLGPNDPKHDALALTCIDQDGAMEVCQALGGTLPSEAQWEHAARGRGQRRIYPWGNTLPPCGCISIARGVSCEGLGPEPVGSHPLTQACGGLGDVSRDGIMDMGGGVAELTADRLLPYGRDCWAGQTVLRDPVCTGPGWGALRGSYWEAGLLTMHTALRRSSPGGPSDGFRCAYTDGS
jgi:hypothetical protein